MSNLRTGSTVLSALTALVLASCGGSTETGEVVKLQGAGASFPAPLYLKWFKAYSSAHQNVEVE